MRARLSQEEGFGLVEVMVSALILAVGLLGLLASFNASAHLTTTVQREQVATAQAEQAMEQLQGLSYTSQWLSSTPTSTTDGNATGDASGNPTKPTFWVGSGTNAGKLRIVQNWSKESSANLDGVSSGYEAFVTSGTTGSGVSPGPTTFTTGQTSGSIYRFITYVTERCSSGTTTTTAAKRLVVAVVLNTRGNAGANKPVWLSSLSANPSPTACS
jgi:Tfp pilus assembly protein PilV